MCEMIAIASETPVSIETILEWSRLLDEYGLAGYGWGMVWSDGDALHRYRSSDGIRKDTTAPRALKGLTLTRGFVHLRRPSLMSTIGHTNAQPYLNRNTEWAFAHNGFLKKHQEYRKQYHTQLNGTSDSEVGFMYWLDRLASGSSVTTSLYETHQALEGNANFMALHHGGDLAIYAGNEENAVYRFDLDSIHLATTSLHSFDQFVFETIFPGAQHVEHLPVGTALLMP